MNQPPTDDSRNPLDAHVGAAMARAWGGLSPISLTLAYTDWLLHLLSSPGSQARLAQQGSPLEWRMTWTPAHAWRETPNIAAAPAPYLEPPQTWPAHAQQCFSALSKDLMAPLTLPALAEVQGEAPRSLQRSLSRAGLSYTHVLSEARCRSASWWLLKSPAPIAEVGFVSGLMVIVGSALTLQALHRDLFRVHLASLQTTGLLIEWSHVPSLTSPLHHDQRFMGWDEVASVQWSEGQQDHDLRQLLDLTFDQPLTPHRDRLQLMVSEGRNLDRCMALVALLPESTARPGWMARAQTVPPLAPDHEQSWVG